MNLQPQHCPICDRSTPTREWAPAQVDFSSLDKFAFSSRKLPEFMHFRLTRCLICDVVFANPAPPIDWLMHHYQEAAFASSGESMLAARSYAALVAPLIPSLPSTTGALDIGAGDGAFLQQLLHLGFTRVRGVEPSQAPILMADPGIRPLLEHGMFTGREVDPESLSLVTCFQTLEHVVQPLDLCRKVADLLQPGGTFLVAVHNYRAWPARLLGTRSPIYDIQHLQLYSPSAIRSLLERVGLQRIHVTPLCNRYPLSYWLRLMPLGKPIKHTLTSLLDRIGWSNRQLSLCPGNLVAFGFKHDPIQTKESQV
ncbi:MAG: class I SAM-dependent methyltransferase [Magnetococcales bacterium]|nr:class I SAM-dependent methyltransferase [Magnetococcales bacterium]